LPPAYFTEEFDGDISSWSYFLMSGDESKMVLFTDNSRLVFDLQRQYFWVFVPYDEYIYSDVRIDDFAIIRLKYIPSAVVMINDL
jgi:hypothetical protein